MNFRSQRSEAPEVNLVSLIDVVLMIVVFFILSSTLVQERSFNISLPIAAATDLLPGEAVPLVLGVRADGQYEIEGRVLERGAASLRRALLAMAAVDAARPVLLRADAEARHREVVLALDILRETGYTSVDIATVQGQSP